MSDFRQLALFWCIVLLMWAVILRPAHSQSWDYTPGGQTGQQNLQVITPWAGGGYAVGAPGQPPVLVQPWGNNGYTVGQPGQQPTLVQPMGNGNWIVTPPLGGPIQPIAPIAPIPPIGGY